MFSRDGADIGQVDANAFQERNGWIGFEHELINPLSVKCLRLCIKKWSWARDGPIHIVVCASMGTLRPSLNFFPNCFTNLDLRLSLW